MAERKMPKAELGYTGLDSWNGVISETWISDLRTSSQRVKKMDEIYRYDPTASSMIKATSMFLSSTVPKVEPASTSPADIEAAEFLTSCLFDMSKSWYEIMADVVLFIVYGFFDMELVYWKRDGTKSKFNDGRIGWRKWAPRHPITLYEWDFDGAGGLQAMVQQGPPNYKTVKIPIEKLLHFTTTGMGKNNPEGVSVLEGAYSSWYYAHNISLLQAILCERSSGVPVIELPEDADLSTATDSDVTIAKNIVRNVKVAEDMGLTLPFGYKFYYETPSSMPAVNLTEIILTHRRNLARNLMMDFILIGGGETGSYALHADKSSLYLRALSVYLKKISNVINRHGVPRLFDLNAFPGISGLPKVYFTPITKIDIGGFADVISRLFNSGALTYDLELATENAIRREVGLPEITEPGIAFKQATTLSGTPEPLPSTARTTPTDVKGQKGGKETSKDASDEDEMSEFSEFTGRLMAHHDAVQYTDRVGKLMIRDYDKLSRQLSEKISQTNKEEDWEEELAAFLMELENEMLDRLRHGMFFIWRRTVGSDPDIFGLSAILSEMEFQKKYLDDSLLPDIREQVLAERAKLKSDLVREAGVALAIAGILATYRYRVSLYAGGVYKLRTNFALSEKIRREIEPIAKKSGETIERDPATGKLRAEGLLASYFGPDDAATCFECHSVMEMGWVPAEIIPPVGSLRCNGNCRHTIRWKFHGRIY